jgi:hypothetical protein
MCARAILKRIVPCVVSLVYGCFPVMHVANRCASPAQFLVMRFGHQMEIPTTELYCYVRNVEHFRGNNNEH